MYHYLSHKHNKFVMLCTNLSFYIKPHITNVSVLFNSILYLFYEEYIQPEATGSSSLSVLCDIYTENRKKQRFYMEIMNSTKTRVKLGCSGRVAVPPPIVVPTCDYSCMRTGQDLTTTNGVYQ